MITSIYKGYRKTRKTRKMLYRNVSGLPVYLWLLIVFFLIYKLFKSELTDWWDSFFGKSKSENLLPVYFSNISAADAEKRADQINSSFGTINDEEDVIYNALRDVNKHGYNRIFNFYGKRIAPVAFGLVVPQDLTRHLMEYLNNDERKHLVSLNPNLSFLIS